MAANRMSAPAYVAYAIEMFLPSILFDLHRDGRLALSWLFGGLIVSRIIFGTGVATINPMAQAYVADAATDQQPATSNGCPCLHG